MNTTYLFKDEGTDNTNGRNITAISVYTFKTSKVPFGRTTLISSDMSTHLHGPRQIPLGLSVGAGWGAWESHLLMQNCQLAFHNETAHINDVLTEKHHQLSISCLAVHAFVMPYSIGL